MMAMQPATVARADANDALFMISPEVSALASRETSQAPIPSAQLNAKYRTWRSAEDKAFYDEALKYAITVPILVYPDGKVAYGWKGRRGCDIF